MTHRCRNVTYYIFNWSKRNHLNVVETKVKSNLVIYRLSLFDLTWPGFNSLQIRAEAPGRDLVPWWAELTWQVSSCCSTLSCMVSEPAAPAATRLLWAFCSHSSSWPTLCRHTWRTPSLGRDPAERGSSGAWDTNTTHPAEPLCSRVTDTEHGGREEGAELSL